MDTMSSVSLLRNLRVPLSMEGSRNTPTANHIMRKNPSLLTLLSRSTPSTLSLMAIDDSITIINTANRSSTISTANTSDANFLWLRLRSLNAFMIMVVDDIESMPPRNRLLMLENPSRCPIENPAHIMPITIISAVTTAEPPALSSFLKLNSRPSENSSTTMPICAQKSMLLSVVTDGRYTKLGLARNPCHYVTEYHRLFYPFEEYGGYGSEYEYEGKVGDETLYVELRGLMRWFDRRKKYGGRCHGLYRMEYVLVWVGTESDGNLIGE